MGNEGIYLKGTQSATQDMDIFRQPREMIEAYFKSLRQTPEEEWAELREAKFSKNIVNGRTPLISVDVAQCLTEIFERELVQARHISRRDMEMRSSWEKEDYGAWLQRELIPYVQEIAKNTRQSAGHAKVISGETVRSRVTLEEIREDGKEQIRL